MANILIREFPATIGTTERTLAAERTGAISWPVWLAALAGTSAMIGEYWDISWHISIGRDTFWTPAHMAIYLAGVLAGISSAYLIFSTTFGSDQAAKDASVSVLGFRGPFASFIAAWGGVAMLTSAPFDNWWHNAYGLDVKIQSPPHTVLALGIGAINLSAILLIASQKNRSEGALRRRLEWLFLYMVAVLFAQSYVFSLEHSNVEAMHSVMFYRAMMETALPLLIAAAVASNLRWPATTVAALYTILWASGVWVMPLFAAQPKLGPVYQHVTHFIPLGFPVLFIFPAIAIDLMRARWRSHITIGRAIVAGILFMLVLAAFQWPFADFLVSPLARNGFFGMNYFGYWDPANILYDPYKFQVLEPTRSALLLAALAALGSVAFNSYLGLAFGTWLNRIRR